MISGPAIEPVTLDEAAAHAQIDADLMTNPQVQTNLTSWIQAAREKVEDWAGISLIERTFELTLRGFPGPCDEEAIVLPQGPVIQVLSVSYLAGDGTATTLDAAAYELLNLNKVWHLVPKFRTFWPYMPRRNNGLTIQYRAGYPSAGSPVDAVNVPELAKLAIKQYVAHFGENRESVVAETRIVPVQVPDTFYDLLQSLRVYP